MEAGTIHRVLGVQRWGTDKITDLNLMPDDDSPDILVNSSPSRNEAHRSSFIFKYGPANPLPADAGTNHCLIQVVYLNLPTMS